MVTLTKITCDFCSADVVEAWYFTHAGFQFQCGAGLVDAEPGEASACAQCKPYVERRDSDALSAHVFGLRPDMRVAIAAITALHRSIIEHLAGPVRHAKLGDVVPPKERFLPYTCPLCLYAAVLDRTTAQHGRIATNCPNCGVQWYIGPFPE